MQGLKQLLIDLGRDGDIKDQYARDPSAIMDRYGCTAEEKKAMLDKDVETLKQLSGLSNLKSNSRIHAYDSE
ncbi:MAG: hypothetical protein ACNA7J_13860 [Wenzhouxiangella sp.]